MGGDVAEGLVFFGQKVTLGAERVEAGSDARRLPDPPTRLVATSIFGGLPDASKVEPGSGRLERLDREEDILEPLEVGRELRAIFERVPFGDDDDVDQFMGIAVLFESEDASRPAQGLATDGRGGGVDLGFEERLVGPVRLASLDQQLDLRLRERHQDRRVIGSLDLLPGLGGRPVLAEIGVEPLREQERIRGRVAKLDQGPADLERVDQVGPAPGPGPLAIEAVEGDEFVGGVAPLEVVDPERGIDEPAVEAGEIVGEPASAEAQDSKKRDEGDQGSHAGLSSVGFA